MALVKIQKLETGDKIQNAASTETPIKLFKLGPRQIQTDELIKKADSNLEPYLENTGWSSKKKEAFRNAYGSYIQAINNGDIKERDLQRNWVDTTGRLKNNPNQGFDANGAVTSFLEGVGDIIPEYSKTPDNKVETQKLDFNEGFKTSLRNSIFGGGDFNKDIWYKYDPLDEKTKKRGISNRLKTFSNVLNNYADSVINDKNLNLEGTAFKNKEDLLNRINMAKSAISNGKLEDNDWTSLAALGINTDYYKNWFGDSDIVENPGDTTKSEIDESKLNKDLVSAGFKPALNDKKEIIYTNADGTPMQNGIINYSFNPKLDKYAGWYKLNGQLLNPADYNKWSPDVRQSYDLANKVDDTTNIYAGDPLFGKLFDKGYLKVRDASSFFNNIGRDEKIYQAYTPSNKAGQASKQQYYFKDSNGNFEPVSISYDQNNNDYVLQGNGISKLLGKKPNGGFQPVEQFSAIGENKYSNSNILGLLKRAGDTPSLLGSSYFREWLEGLFSMYDAGKLNNMVDSKGRRLTDLINKNTISYDLIPNRYNTPLRVDRNDKYFGNIRFGNNTPINAKLEDGGIIKNQFGGTLKEKASASKTELPAISSNQAKANDRAFKSIGKSAPMTIGSLFGDNSKTDQDTINAGGQLTASDRVKLGAAVTDLASVIAGFVPVPFATVASAAVGAGASLTEFGADVAKEGFNWGSVGNLGLNLGMDTLSIIPGMKALKAMKTVGKIAKFVPAISTAIAAAGIGLDPDQRSSILTSLKKVVSEPSSLDTNDFKNLSIATSIALGAKHIVNSNNIKSPFGIVNKLKGIQTQKTDLQTVKVRNSLGETKDVTFKNSELEGKKFSDLEEAAKNKAKSLFGIDTTDGLTVDQKGMKAWKFDNRRLDTSKVEGKQYKSDIGAIRNWAFNGTEPKGKLDKAFYSWLNGKEPYIGMPNNARLGEQSINPSKQLRLEYTPNAPIKGTVLNPSERRGRLIGKGISEEDLNAKGIFKKGGILKAKYGTKFRNVISKPSLNWQTGIYGTDSFNDTLAGINPSNIGNYNNLQSNYGKIFSNRNNPTGNLKFDSNVAKYQGEFNNLTSINSGAMTNLVKNGLITGRGGSSDKGVNWTPDGLAGTETWLRHLGTKETVTPEIAKNINKQVNPNGVEYFLDKDNMYKFRPNTLSGAGIIPTSSASTQTFINPVTKKIQLPPAKPQSSNTVGVQESNNNGFNIDPTEVLPAARLIGNIWNNNRISKQVKNSIKPVLNDTWEMPLQVVGDLGTKQEYTNQANKLQSLASRPRTSDSSLQLAGELDAGLKGAELIDKGNLADNQMIRETTGQSLQNNMQAADRRSQVSNINREKMFAAEKAKSDIDAASKSANWTSMETFLKEKEYNAKLDRDRQRQFNINVGTQNIEDNASIKVNLLLDQLKKKYPSGNIDYNDPLYKQYEDESKRAGNDIQNKTNQLFASTYGLRFPKTKYVFMKKSGGTLPEKLLVQKQKDISAAERKNAELFDKNVQNTIKNNITLINGLSSITKQMILKAMT